MFKRINQLTIGLILGKRSKKIKIKKKVKESNKILKNGNV